MGNDRDARSLSIEGLCNARDLGGLPRLDGDLTPHGTFYRSENLNAVTPAGWQQLHALGIRTVVDLRQPAERSDSIYQAPSWLTVQQVDHDGLDDHPGFWADYWENGLVGTALYYLPHVQQLPERSADVLSAIAQAPEGGVMFHCMAGRDRTGIIAMLLLEIGGTDQDAIVDDYLESVRNGAAIAVARGRPDNEPACEDLCRRHGTTTEGAFRDVLTGLDTGQVMSLLSPENQKVLKTWRGALG